MSWLLKYRKKDNKWRIWTTISDGWITDWLTENEVKQALSNEYKRDYRLQVIECYMTFPAGWHDKDTHKLLAIDKKAFYEWQMEALHSKDYEKEIDKKYKDLLSPL